ncbi:NAD(P)/FAD-dependent oxidoreductase [Haliangium ochraceum]|uniref:FAD dependent oxidoreductase n=1 Tax=Haliangium ochraceum (strain DSM 14365 / JCM 11303 / SMP-2) TaxID=502025 RepID=D0LI22_HALO1|nr:FAD-binding oxidoreductase [Haliangium ochraceum]ACY14851.1 FAD dependent oxidoreductase [Haliangium ochraceum DSM 14365]
MARRDVIAQPLDAPVPERAEVVIIGAGVMGLSIAYHMARRGLSDIVVLDKGYLANGASGRNGGGVRQQWSTELNIRLMKESVERCRRFAKDLGVNIWFRQGGYLFLARTPAAVERLTRNVALQERCGLPTRMIGPDEISDIVPALDTTGILAGAFNPSDGIVFPWPFLWGFGQRAVALGARLFTHTPVRAIELERGGFCVHTERGSVRARRVVNAAGAWSRDIARMVGVELPTYPVRHEICSSEPLKPFLGPLVSELGTGLYCSQSMRGELVGGVSMHDEGPTISMSSRLRFLTHYATRLTALFPTLGDLKVLRQWAGPYDQSPDGNPILGEPPGVPGFFLACGFVGHGFMMAPIVGDLYGAWLTGEPPHELFERSLLQRFEGGGAVEKEDFNIG